MKYSMLWVAAPIMMCQMLVDMFSKAVKANCRVSGMLPDVEIMVRVQDTARTRRVILGAFAPDFTQNTPDGVPLALSSLRGQFVLVDFWASWCGPCRQENKNLLMTYIAFKNERFTVLSVSLDKEDRREDWLNAIENDGLAWPQVSDLNGWQNAAARAYDVHSIPQCFLLDPSGKVIAINLRGNKLYLFLRQKLDAFKQKAQH